MAQSRLWYCSFEQAAEQCGNIFTSLTSVLLTAT